MSTSTGAKYQRAEVLDDTKYRPTSRQDEKSPASSNPEKYFQDQKLATYRHVRGGKVEQNRQEIETPDATKMIFFARNTSKQISRMLASF